MKLTVLIENTRPDNSTLIAEHGLSFLVETAQSKFIFDCGHTGAAWQNAQTLGVDLSGIKIAVLSHSHYDHSGGFPKLLEHAPIEKIFTGVNFWDEKFSRVNGDDYIYRGCGFDEKFLSEHGIEQIVCRDVTEIDEDIWLIGNFKRRYFCEIIPSKFVKGATRVPDDFSDEIALVMRTDDGLAVVTACAHSGILSIVTDIAERFSEPVVTIIGGMHLNGVATDKIIRTIDEFKLLGVKKILPCHCSGEEFINHFDEKICTGSIINL
ncbi:MAG: MBL fold metallo-hydrolase [Selenomonadaceae bacterium]|nr:MBL fold metallo-hydrolase [Selenomonadaceae bacterium]